MIKKGEVYPEWCVALADRLANRTTPKEHVLEAIAFDISMFDEESAKARWEKVAERLKK